MRARRLARSIWQEREAATAAMVAAAAGEDIEALRAAIDKAITAGVHLSPKGKTAVESAKVRAPLPPPGLCSADFLHRRSTRL